MHALHLIYVSLGFIYAVVATSFIFAMDNYFFHQEPVTTDMWLMWGTYIFIPAVIAATVCGIYDMLKYADDETPTSSMIRQVALSPIDVSWIIPCITWGIFYSWIIVILDVVAAQPWGYTFLQDAIAAWGLPAPEPSGSFTL